MRVLDRMLLLLAALLLTLLGIVGVLAALGWDPAGAAHEIATFLVVHRLEAAILGILLLAGGAHLGYHGLARPKQRGIVRETQLGQVQIQYRAIENLVVRTAQEVKGVRDVEASIEASGEGVGIQISCNVLPEVRIPELCDEVQHRVDEAVREMVGVIVTSVTVDVRTVLGPVKSRVE